jgi:uncharacterized protein
MKRSPQILLFTALLSGLLFGFGLILAGMTNPAKVLGFLDITGTWDPSLAFVMIGAIGVGLFAFKWASHHPTSLLQQSIHLPGTHLIDKRLVIGGTLFGAGWGLVGICPGPAIVLMGTGHQSGIIFVCAMLAGMVIFELLNRFKKYG